MTDAPVSALRRRMIEDMTSRRLVPKTQEAYIRAVKNFTAFFGRSPDQASAEDLRRYHLHLASTGITTPKLNAAVSALRFFFSVTPGRQDVTERLPFVREPRKLQVVLSPEEVARILEAAPAHESRSTERGLWRRPARRRGGRAQGLRHRQHAHGHSRRARQGAERIAT